MFRKPVWRVFYLWLKRECTLVWEFSRLHKSWFCFRFMKIRGSRCLYNRFLPGKRKIYQKAFSNDRWVLVFWLTQVLFLVLWGVGTTFQKNDLKCLYNLTLFLSFLSAILFTHHSAFPVLVVDCLSDLSVPYLIYSDIFPKIIDHHNTSHNSTGLRDTKGSILWLNRWGTCGNSFTLSELR